VIAHTKIVVRNIRDAVIDHHAAITFYVKYFARLQEEESGFFGSVVVLLEDKPPIC